MGNNYDPTGRNGSASNNSLGGDTPDSMNDSSNIIGYNNGNPIYRSDGGGNYSSIGGGTQYVIGVGPQIFRVTCTGMKPNTLHKAYLVTTDVSVDCAMISNYVWGSALISDASGRLEFDYKFNPSNSPFTTKSYATGGTTALVAIIPVGNQKFYVTSSDGNSYAQNYIQQK